MNEKPIQRRTKSRNGKQVSKSHYILMNNVRGRRKQLRMVQEDVAKEMRDPRTGRKGVAQSNVSALEQGRFDPTFDYFEQLAKILSCSPFDLLTPERFYSEG